MDKLKILINLFEENLKLNPEGSFIFDLNTEDSQLCWDFIIKYLKKNTNQLLGYRGKIIFNIIGNHIEQFVCGIAPMWKEYESKDTFERYYTTSSMMRELYCNEKDDKGNLIPLYVSINNKKFIITWESNASIDIFNYHKTTVEERGLLDIFFEIFGGEITKRKNITYKKINPCIAITIDQSITNQFGYGFGTSRKICDHIDNLGFLFNGKISISLN